MLHSAALLLLYLSAPATAPARGEVDPLVARTAANIQAALGRQPGGMMRFTGARGEGRTLILDIELEATTPEMFGPPQIASLVAAGLCEEARSAAFFGDGRLARINVVRGGRALGSATIERCPGPVGEGISASTFASVLQPLIGIESGGMRIESIRPDGSSLIVKIDVVSGAIGGAAAAANFIDDFCRRAEVQGAFFEHGLTLRVDTTVRGRDPLTGTPIASCPGR